MIAKQLSSSVVWCMHDHRHVCALSSSGSCVVRLHMRIRSELLGLRRHGAPMTVRNFNAVEACGCGRLFRFMCLSQFVKGIIGQTHCFLQHQ